MDELRGFLNVKTAHDAAIHSICLVVKSNIASVGTKQSRTEALEHITCIFFSICTILSIHNLLLDFSPTLFVSYNAYFNTYNFLTQNEF